DDHRSRHARHHGRQSRAVHIPARPPAAVRAGTLATRLIFLHKLSLNRAQGCLVIWRREVGAMEKLETRRWTRREYDRMVEAGILGEDDPVELIDGEIVKMAPEGRPHASAVRRAHIALQRVFGPQRYVQVGLPMAPDDVSEPEPDLAVLPGTVEDFEGEHPATALLVVEVAESSLSFDRKRKGGLYARAGITEYWIVN